MSQLPVSSKRAIRMLQEAFRDLGWQDTGGTAQALVLAHANGTEFKSMVSSAFTARNDCAPDAVASLAVEVLADVIVAAELPAIISPEQIDSFAEIATIAPTQLGSIDQPLSLPEQEVKRMVLGILGELDADKDWGGERSDAFTTNVWLRGERVATSFVLKGPSQKGVLTPARYGKNGDQIQRSFTQPARLHVVQTNARLAPSVRELLSGLVYQARAEGNPQAVGSVWDGIDTARLLVAYGYIDADGGKPLK